MTARARLLPALAGATARRITWWSVAGCIAAALTLTWLVTSRDQVATHQILTVLRWSAVLLAGGVASVLDDPTEDDLAGTATPVWWRRALALTMVAAPTAAAWTGSLLLADRPLPWAALSLEAAALILLGCGVASTRPLRRSNLPAGLTATLLPAVVLIVAIFLPPDLALLAEPGAVEAWRQVHVRWALLAALAVVVLAVTARDRARRPAWRALRPARPHPSPSPPARATSDSLPEAS